MSVSAHVKFEARAPSMGSPRDARRRRLSQAAAKGMPFTNAPRNLTGALSADDCAANVKSAKGSSDKPSVLLRQLLARNASAQSFTLQTIVDHMGPGHPEASLMLLSVPGMIPVPTTSDLVGSPTMVIAGQMMAARKTVRLPPSLRERSVPRRALAIAIHAVLPILERAERMTKKRWDWACTPAARRVLGALVFLIALPLAIPFLGFNIPHAASIFTISIGIMEKDGLAIALGVAAGMTSLILLTSTNLLPRTLVRKSATWIKNLFSKTLTVRNAFRSVMRYAVSWVNERIFNGPPPSRDLPLSWDKTSRRSP